MPFFGAYCVIQVTTQPEETRFKQNVLSGTEFQPCHSNTAAAVLLPVPNVLEPDTLLHQVRVEHPPIFRCGLIR